jgi:hypothetical protein
MRRLLQLVGSPLIDPRRIPITPNIPRQNRLVPNVDRVAYSLTDQVRTDRMALKTHLLQKIPLGLAIPRVYMRFVHLEMVTPTGQLNPVVTGILGKLSHLAQR